MVSKAGSIVDMRKIRSERFPNNGWLPEGRGLRTCAEAAASLCGICAQVGGGFGLACSEATDPISTSWYLSWSRGVDDDPRADSASLAYLSWEWVKAMEEGLRADSASLANLSLEVAKV